MFAADVIRYAAWLYFRYADLASTDHLSIDEAGFDELRGFFSEPQIVQLGVLIAFFIGFRRLAAYWDMIEELPQGYQDKGHAAAPWSQESVLVRG